MPAKRIKVIDIENNTTRDEEPTRDDIIDIIKEDQPIVVQPEEPVVMKKKRAPRPKVPVFEKVEQQPEPVVEPVVELAASSLVGMQPVVVEPVVEVEPDDEPKNIKTIELVSCPKCNKKLTARTLKYSHESVCPENGHPPPSTKGKFKRKPTNREESLEHVIEQYIEHIPALTAYDKRLLLLKKKQDKIKKLAVHAF